MILKIENVLDRAIETVGPKVRSGSGLDELRGDAQAAARLAHAPLEDVSNPELAPCLPHIHDFQRDLNPGWLAGKVVRGNGFDLVGDAAIGIVGALIGDWLLHRLGIHFVSGIIGLTINATIGAIVLLLACRPINSDGVAAVAQAGERGPRRVRQPAGGGDKLAERPGRYARAIR